ncbi:transcription antitermination factor NusB [Conexibacter sp. CPCC 206217]|uniref:transcription antitermination factor NusB n=1 Tax=Conexibacter sp. CPCC 206217 TaxID=3064574 RepID=UPI002723B4C6|nr:transcription antitermination factor NusB [Conexibacter sp. CPCC 206217]MDO8210813.1 transcription antitermination factor NusB [Conexibacter sp. CPCC 206217]
MSRRSDQRREAVFALYQHDLTGRPLDDTLPKDAATFTQALARAALARQPEFDDLISRHAEGWTLSRIAPLERSIMRVSLLEMLHPGDVPAERSIPPEGAIDEAIETAKAYCGAEAPGFLNGVLAAILREHRAADGATSGNGSENGGGR